MRRRPFLVLFLLTAVACGSDPAGTVDASDGPMGTGGGQGGASGGTGGTAGNTSPITIDGGDLGEVGQASYCAPCVDEAAAQVMACPAQRPVTADDLKPICTANLSVSTPAVTVRFGDCTLLSPLPGCSATAPEDTVLVLSIGLGSRGGLDCHYARATGALVGQAVSADSPHFCGNRAYVAATASVTNAWCRAGGADSFSVSCSTAVDGGVDHASPDALPASACSACGPNELCVAYYDGQCKPLYSTCNQVTATTRQAILVDHARCFDKPMGDEICGTRDGQHFWGCGEPACPNETLESDIDCYGP